MSKLYSVLILTFFSLPAFSQNLAQVTIGNNGTPDIFTFLVDGTVAVNITKDGKVIDWGIEYTYPAAGVYPRLEQYMGKEEYYPETENEAYRGKIKYIGRTLFTYYTSNDYETLKGKAKSIGSSMLDYYREYENDAFNGFLKSAAHVSITYYTSFEDQFYKGRIKSVGGTTLTYYGSVDDKAYRGKIKSVDRNLFTYYSSYDRREYSGMMKMGSPMVTNGGVKFIIKNY